MRIPATRSEYAQRKASVAIAVTVKVSTSASKPHARRTVMILPRSE
ncbi:MAG: hypothetical protein IJV98_07880 [Clostridia bacterium]|nr:hypothetical protein [Clostridia bacterium]